MDLFKKLKGMEILLIDDDEWIRDSLTLFFTGEGCHLSGLATAEEAIEALENKKYDIIISDYKLPGMDGLEFLRRAKKSDPDMMTILITAYGSEDLLSEAKKLGIYNFIQKPLTTDALEKSLANLLERHEAGENNARGVMRPSE